MKKIRLFSLLLSLVMIPALFSACTGSQAVTEPPADTNPPATQASTDTVPPKEDNLPEGGAYFPITEEPAELSLWAALSNSMMGYYESWGDIPVFQEYEEMTNVHINFNDVSAMEGNDQFNIMVASGEYTDMVLMLAGRYAGGASKALEDDIIIALEDVIEEYAPEYWALLTSDDELRRSVYTDEGHILAMYGFSTAIESEGGLLIRQDWLDELGLDVPTTYEEIAAVADAFKVNYGCTTAIMVDETGLVNQYGSFVGGYGTKGFRLNAPADVYSASEFYQIDGELQCSFLDDGYRDFLSMLSDWYKAGYFTSDWISIMGFQDAWIPYIMDNSTGIFYGSASIINYVYSNHTDPDIKLTAIPEPSFDGESKSKFFVPNSKRHNTASISVTTECGDPILAVAWINGLFTDEGIILANWGVENQSWAYDANGDIAFTELMTDNDSGASLDVLLHMYAIYSEWPTLNIGSAYTLYDEETLDIIEFWNNSGTGEYLLPRGVALTTEESTEFSVLAADFETYASENIAAFIIGEKDISEWDDFRTTLDSMSMYECMDIYQDALDRYFRR